MSGSYSHSLGALIGDKIGSFLMDCSFPGGAPVNDLLRQMAIQLLAFQEEGEALIPQVLVISPGVDERAVFPNSGCYALGQVSLDQESAKKILKIAARLASEHTIIYVRIESAASISFGILHHGQQPSQAPPDRALLSDDPQDPLHSLAVALISPTKAGQLRVITPARTFEFSLRGSPQGDGRSIEIFASMLSPDVVNRDGVSYLISQGVDRCARMGHGCIALMCSEPDSVLAKFSKRVVVTPSIDLMEAAKAEVEAERACEVFAGMLSTDLATIITTKGKVVAFNAHIPSGEASDDIIGGARTQAWWAAKKIKNMVSGLIVSQDGGSRVWVNDK